MNEPLWLVWARELQAIAQTGLAFSRDPYDRERYEALRALAARMFAARSDASAERTIQRQMPHQADARWTAHHDLHGLGRGSRRPYLQSCVMH